MLDRFDDATYWTLLERLSATHRILRFQDVRSGFPEHPFVLLRHDVDYSPAAALRLARKEAERSVRASYFLLLNTFHYNLLAPEHADLPRTLVALGHEVGLHYDVRFLTAFPPERHVELLELQADLLSSLAGAGVVSIARHQPALCGTDPVAGRTHFLDAYGQALYGTMPYVSDSCRAYRDASFAVLSSERPPDRFQLVLHPENWNETDRDRTSIYDGVHRDLSRFVEAAGADLLGKIARHDGVLEHERRRAKRDVEPPGVPS